MSAHTPGPWSLAPSGMSVWCDEPGSRTEVASTRGCAIDFETDRANARLIAAAPDLLAAAHETVSAIEDEHRIHGRDDDYIYDTLGSGLSAAYFSARDAIAKATGGAA